MDKSSLLEKLERKLDELKPFWKAMYRERKGDIATAILPACLLDGLLEKLIRAAYVKNPQVKSLFKNESILQSFFSKINIAYFSGLIPDILYHDLKIICEIRNKFAHAITADLSFTDRTIAQRVEKF